MAKLSADEINNVVSVLIGKTAACGDYSKDRERIANLKTLITVIKKCLYEVELSASDVDATEWSVKHNGEVAYSGLVEIRNMINECLDEIDTEQLELHNHS